MFMKLLMCPGRSEGARIRCTWASKTTALVEPSTSMRSPMIQVVELLKKALGQAASRRSRCARHDVRR